MTTRPRRPDTAKMTPIPTYSRPSAAGTEPNDYTSPPKHRQNDSDSESHHFEELPLSSSEPLAPSRVPILDQAGTWVVVLLSGSLTLLTASLIILSWIWFGDVEGERWRQLILGPNSDLAITLTSVAIRASVATISWITACMMASVVVERYGVPPDRVAQASIARYTGALVSMMFGGYAMKRYFRIMIPLQMACAIASQFSSTLLFSDLGSITLTSFPRELDMSYDFGPISQPNSLTSLLYIAQSVYATRWSSDQPPAFEAFAEYAEPESRILANGVDDTGPIWRAFLPIGNESLRTSIREYTGVARVFDARTICVRPEINELKYNYRVEDGYSGVSSWIGRAVLNTSQIPNIFDPENVTSEVSFTCAYHDTNRPKAPGHQWVQCSTADTDIPPPHAPRRVGTLDPLFYNTSAADLLEAEEARWLDDNGLDAQRTKAIDGEPITPRVRMQERRTGDGYILMDLGNANSSAVITAGGYELNDLKLKPGNSSFVSTLSLLSSTGNGPWNDFKAEFNASQKTGKVLLEQMRIGALPFRATYCMDVMM